MNFDYVIFLPVIWFAYAIPSFLVSGILSYSIMRFEVLRSPTIRLFRIRAVAISISLFALCFGAVTGYFFGEFYGMEKNYSSSTFLHDIFGGPGDFITNTVHHKGLDWQGGEIWYYRPQIIIWNAIFWMSLGLANMIVFLKIYLPFYVDEGPPSNRISPS